MESDPSGPERKARERTRRWMDENPEQFEENQQRFREAGGYMKSLRKTRLKMNRLDDGARERTRNRLRRDAEAAHRT